MNKIKLKSGAMLEITPASFKDAKSLLNAIATELKKINIDIKVLDMTQELNGDVLNTFKNVILEVITSNEIESELNKCFETCLYNNSKVNDDLFVDMKAREDYFIICWEVARTNLLPFMKSLNFGLISESLKSKANINIQK